MTESEKKKKKALCGWKQGRRSDYNRREEAMCWKKKGAESEREDAALLALKLRKQSWAKEYGRAAADAGKGKKVDSLFKLLEGA